MVNGVARLVKMCRSRSRLDKLMHGDSGWNDDVRQSVRVQYIGETKRQLHERFGEHLRSIQNHHDNGRKTDNKQTYQSLLENI